MRKPTKNATLTMFQLVGRMHQHHAYTPVQVRQIGSLEGGSDDAQPLIALFDTGARRSAIRADIVKRLGLPVVQRERTRTMSGAHVAELVRARIEIEALRGRSFVRDITAYVIPHLDDDDTEMVIGMTEMLEGVFIVDGPAARWEWVVSDNRPGAHSRIELGARTSRRMERARSRRAKKN